MSRLDDLERRIEALERELRVSKPLSGLYRGVPIGTSPTAGSPVSGFAPGICSQGAASSDVRIGGGSAN